ncbi:hypothetical protein SAMN04487783_0389 [Agrococcus baldri]|uniref:Transcriptional regulator, AbiEi antitoxin, Type IV TA system n=1 Tax=Agrococcus baldri TaxID=153730 RepID=A0AA94HKS4_9MICO|nr:hypothetical protein [Agrococcus baldri]SFR99809.1 hypothetical protein SAMN04487783_0389 [Agrococcus baldri]
MRESDIRIWEQRALVQRAGDLLEQSPGQPSRNATLVRIRHGVYARADEVGEDAHGVRYLARIEAVAEVRKRPIFARESALAVHGNPYGKEPERVFTAGGSKTAGLKAGVQHDRAELDDADIVECHGLLVVSLPHALADLARHRDQRVAVAAIDAALHEQRTTKAAIREALARQSRMGRAKAEAAIAFADGRAESVGESWSRVVMHLLGFSAPQLQQAVLGGSGAEYFPDFRWVLPELPRPLLGEFDGMKKYGRIAAEQGRTPQEALAREKFRDDDLRVDNDTAHWVWADLLEPTRLERILLAHRLPRVRRRSLWLPRTA